MSTAGNWSADPADNERIILASSYATAESWVHCTHSAQSRVGRRGGTGRSSEARRLATLVAMMTNDAYLLAPHNHERSARVLAAKLVDIARRVPNAPTTIWAFVDARITGTPVYAIPTGFQAIYWRCPF